MAGKYVPLENFLRRVPVGQSDVTLTFEQIERILNDKLPPSAHLHQAWWANERDGQHVNAHAWREAGWKVVSADQRRAWVRFRRA